MEGRLSIDDVVELLAGIPQPDEHQRQRPLGDAVRRPVGRVDRPDAPLPRSLHVDPAANLSPSSSPTNRRFGQASMISPVTRGDPM